MDLLEPKITQKALQTRAHAHFLKAFSNGKDGFPCLQSHNTERFLT